jgi:hypothetical protein
MDLVDKIFPVCYPCQLLKNHRRFESHICSHYHEDDDEDRGDTWNVNDF